MNNNIHKLAQHYLNTAISLSNLSKVETLQVGAVIVDTQGNIVGVGYNSAPFYLEDPQDLYETTVHAEEMALLSRSNQPHLLVCTHAPCLSCASKMFLAGVKEVWYKNPYKNDKGLQYLERLGIKTKQYE